MTRFEAGYSKTPLHKKLGCRADRPITLIGAPDGFAEYLEEHGFDSSAVGAVDDVAEGAGHVHVFTTEAAVVRHAFDVLAGRIARDGQVWVSWPKKASKVPTDIGKDLLHSSDAMGDLVDVKVCAIDATWSGLKYVIRRDRR